MSPQKKKIQGPGTAMRFWGLVWSDKTCVVSEAVFDHGQAYPTSKNMKEAPFSLCRDLGVLFPHLSLIPPGKVWGWGSE